MLRWQEDTVRDLLSGPSGADVRALHPSLTYHLSATIVATTPIPLEVAAEVERVAALPAGSLRPYGRVPEHDELPTPDGNGLLVVEDEPVETGPNLPAERLLALIDQADARGVDRIDLMRSANLEPRMLNEVEQGVRTLVATSVVQRASRCLGGTDAALLPDSGSPYILLQDVRAGRRFVLRARMTSGRAEAIRAAVGHCGVVEIVPASGPTEDAVAISLDVMVEADAGDALIRAMFTR
jgi:hypothetical protein